MRRIVVLLAALSVCAACATQAQPTAATVNVTVPQKQASGSADALFGGLILALWVASLRRSSDSDQRRKLGIDRAIADAKSQSDDSGPAAPHKLLE
jgi:hypothetical protein